MSGASFVDLENLEVLTTLESLAQNLQKYISMCFFSFFNATYCSQVSLQESVFI